MSASDYAWAFTAARGGGASAAEDTADSEVDFMSVLAAADKFGNAAGESFSGIVYVRQPANTSIFTVVDGHLSGVNSAGGSGSIFGGGVYLATTAVTAIRFLMESGNTTDGRITMYCVAHQ